eukprot:3849544-Prymnesium_polylepis.1
MGFSYREHPQIACKILDFCIPILGKSPPHPIRPKDCRPHARHGGARRGADADATGAWARPAARGPTGCAPWGAELRTAAVHAMVGAVQAMGHGGAVGGLGAWRAMGPRPCGGMEGMGCNKYK